MSSNFHFIDRRKNQKGKSDTNRYRFLQRYHQAIKTAVHSAINARSIQDATEQGIEISVPKKTLREPRFQYDYETGVRHGVNIGNTKYGSGDLVLKPEDGEGQGKGRQGSPDGEGEDDFRFTISSEEFQQYFFSDLQLPNLVNQSMNHVEMYKKVRTGFSPVGNPCNLDLVRSMRKSFSREIAMDEEVDFELKSQLLQLEQELLALLNITVRSVKQQQRVDEIKQLMAVLAEQESIDSISMDKMDLQFRAHSVVPIPNTRAVMFCLMDVSGSMGEHEKNLAKRFFILLHLFLKREYERIEVRFIRHHTIAQEVDEETFFYDPVSGGTVVSTVMQKMDEIIKKDYNDGTWNVYAAQASDGDNFDHDNVMLSDILQSKILPALQYFAYIEVTDPNHSWRSSSEQSSVWSTYVPLSQRYSHMAITKVNKSEDIFEVFSNLFRKTP